MSTDHGSRLRELIERARTATGELRDAAREGRVIDFRKRDRLVLAIHDALDAAEEALARDEALLRASASAPPEKEPVKMKLIGACPTCGDLKFDTIPEVAASASALSPEPAWQPIETAPRPTSGRRKIIDVWCVTDDHESAQFYFGNTMSGVKDQMMWQGRVSEVYWLDGAWRPATGLRMHGLTVTPTHWMPLPAAPGAAVSPSPSPSGNREPPPQEEPQLVWSMEDGDHIVELTGFPNIAFSAHGTTREQALHLLGDELLHCFRDGCEVCKEACDKCGHVPSANDVHPAASARLREPEAPQAPQEPKCAACGAPTLKPGERHAKVLPPRTRPDFSADVDDEPLARASCRR